LGDTTTPGLVGACKADIFMGKWTKCVGVVLCGMVCVRFSRVCWYFDCNKGRMRTWRSHSKNCWSGCVHLLYTNIMVWSTCPLQNNWSTQLCTPAKGQSEIFLECILCPLQNNWSSHLCTPLILFFLELTSVHSKMECM
jgi:hypothetical protein